jgi:hypothetical protein
MHFYFSIKASVFLFPTQPAVHCPPLGNFDPLANEMVLAARMLSSLKNVH